VVVVAVVVAVVVVPALAAAMPVADLLLSVGFTKRSSGGDGAGGGDSLPPVPWPPLQSPWP
jgi:hypothetical protein